jgi:hypothetical protein
MKKYLTREDVDRLLNVDRSKRCATQTEIKMIQNAINERAIKKGISIENFDQNDMDEILKELGIPDVEIITMDPQKWHI